jgi:hypothetical protein
MPKQWNQKDVEAAFDQALTKAVSDQQLRRELLNDATAKNVFAKAGDINVPDGVEVIFYREEDLPVRMVMAIPGGTNPRPAKFKSCFLCTYDTYVTRTSADAKALADILAKLL